MILRRCTVGSKSQHKKTDLEVLKAAIRGQLENLIRLNKTCADFQGKFEEFRAAEPTSQTQDFCV